MYHPSTTHNYCMIPPSVKKINSNSSPVSLLCLAVSTQSAYNLGQWGGGGGGGYSHFFLKTPKIKKFKISNPKNTLHIYENIRVHPGAIIIKIFVVGQKTVGSESPCRAEPSCRLAESNFYFQKHHPRR